MSKIIKKGYIYLFEKFLFMKKWPKYLMILTEDENKNRFIVICKSGVTSKPAIDENSGLSYMNPASNKIYPFFENNIAISKFSDEFKKNNKCKTEFSFLISISMKNHFYICVDTVHEAEEWAQIFDEIKKTAKEVNHSIKSVQPSRLMSAIQLKLRNTFNRSKAQKQVKAVKNQIDNETLDRHSLPIPQAESHHDLEKKNPNFNSPLANAKYRVNSVWTDPPHVGLNAVDQGTLEFSSDELIFHHGLSSIKTPFISWTYDSIRRYGTAKNIFTIDTIAKLSPKTPSTIDIEGIDRIYKFSVTEEKLICAKFIQFAKNYADRIKNIRIDSSPIPNSNNSDSKEKTSSRPEPVMSPTEPAIQVTDHNTPKHEPVVPSDEPTLKTDMPVTDEIEKNSTSHDNSQPISEISVNVAVSDFTEKSFLSTRNRVNHQFRSPTQTHYITLPSNDAMSSPSSSHESHSLNLSTTTPELISDTSIPCETFVYQDMPLPNTQPIYMSTTQGQSNNIETEDDSIYSLENEVKCSTTIEVVKSPKKEARIINSETSAPHSIICEVFEPPKECCLEFKEKLFYFEKLNVNRSNTTQKIPSIETRVIKSYSEQI